MANRGVNKVILLGTLGQAPELRYMPNGTPVCRVSMATNESWIDKTTGAKQERTEWHRVVLFSKAAEIVAEFLGVGDRLFIEGKLTTQKWQDDNGIDRYTTEIIAREFQLMGSKRGDDAGDNSPEPEPAAGVDDDQIPF